MKSRSHDQLPEGIEEALPAQARRLETLRRVVLDCFERWGYQLVIPPLVEFQGSLVAGGEALDRQTFRLTDQLSGRTLGVRTDITPQIARIDRQQMPQDQCVRLCYAGSVLRARPETLGGGRNPIQAGVELYGHDGVQSDLEVVLLLCDVLRTAGCDQWTLALGHAGVFHAVAEQAGWNDEQREQLLQILSRKSGADTKEWLAANPSDKKTIAAVQALLQLSGSREAVLDRASTELAGVRSAIEPALAWLREIAQAVQTQHPQVSVHFDLAEASGFHYESGAVFAAYREGHGQEIARGGHYDIQGERSATGFSLDLRTLLRSSALPATDARRIRAAYSTKSGWQQAVADLRAQGRTVVQAFSDDDSAAALECAEELIAEKGGWVVRPVEKS